MEAPNWEELNKHVHGCMCAQCVKDRSLDEERASRQRAVNVEAYELLMKLVSLRSSDSEGVFQLQILAHSHLKKRGKG